MLRDPPGALPMGPTRYPDLPPPAPSPFLLFVDRAALLAPKVASVAVLHLKQFRKGVGEERSDEIPLAPAVLDAGTSADIQGAIDDRTGPYKSFQALAGKKHLSILRSDSAKSMEGVAAHQAEEQVSLFVTCELVNADWNLKSLDPSQPSLLSRPHVKTKRRRRNVSEAKY